MTNTDIGGDMRAEKQRLREKRKWAAKKRARKRKKPSFKSTKKRIGDHEPKRPSYDAVRNNETLDAFMSTQDEQDEEEQ